MRLIRLSFILILISSSLLMAGKSFAQTKKELKDTVFFNNGEILVGELKQIVYGKATFDSDAIGLVSIKIYKVRSFRTTIATLRLETTDRQRLYGKLEPSGIKDTIYLVNGSSRIKLAISEISSIVPFRRNFFAQLDGNVAAGLSFTRSSGIGQFNFSGNVKYTSSQLVTELVVSALGTIDSTGFSRDQENEQLSSFHYIKSTPWFVEAAVGHQRNVELSLAHRYQALTGGGYKFLTRQTLAAFVLSGVAFASEQNTSGAPSQGLQVEIPLILRLDYFKFSHPNMQITMTNAGYASLTTDGRYRYDGNLTFAWEIISDFSITTNLYGNLDTKPLNPESGKVDYGLVMGLSYKF